MNSPAAAEREPQALPDSCQGWYELGLSLMQRRDRPGACKAFLSALALEPTHSDAHYHLGQALSALGQAKAAQQAYAQALRHNPAHLEAALALAALWGSRGHYEGADVICRLALMLAPERADLHFLQAHALHKLKRYEQALQAYERALALDGAMLEARNNLGAVLISLGRHQQAQEVLHELQQTAPHSASAWINLGNSYWAQGRSERAESAFRRALELEADNTTALDNLASLMAQIGRPADAEALLRRSLAVISSGSASTEVNLAFLLLGQGRYAEGLRRYEARWSPRWPADVARIAQAPELDYPPWQGEPLQAKRVLVVHEQGAGDQIQFVRYLPLLLARGPQHITLICPAALQPLFEQFESPRLSVRTVSRLDELAPHDYWVLLLSLPLHLGTGSVQDIPARLPYLRADAQRQQHWREQLPQAVRRVGLVWKGSAGHRNDALRSLPYLSSLAPLWRAQGLAFVSLQKGQGEDEASAAPADMPLTHLGSQIQDFADSAAIVSQLDLVVCVDTGLAHLAGALGVACWVLLPHARTDWRWLHEREDSPWYPAALRLFRQKPDEPWGAVIESVATQLCLWSQSDGGAGAAR